MKRQILISIGLFLFLNSSGQCPYQLDWKKDGALLGTAAVLVGTDVLLNQHVDPLDTDEIALLDQEEVNRLDRFAANNYSEAAGLRSDIGLLTPMTAGLLSPVVLPALNTENDKYFGQAGTLLLIWLETNLINIAGTDITKSLVLRTRPYVYNAEVPMAEKTSTDARKSFFSGHTSISAANAFLLARYYSDYYPDSRWKPLVWTVAALVPAWTGLERVNAGKHFPTDVVAGYAFGALCGYIIPGLHMAGDREKPVSGIDILPCYSWQGAGVRLSMAF